MFNIFKKIKNTIMNEETKNMKQQIAEAIAVAQRLGEENKNLRVENGILKSENGKLREEMDSAIERVRYLADQIKMMEAQKTAATQFNDRERNY